jgi:SET domain-containing protein
MLLIETRLAQSPTHGIGLFAAQHVEAGAKIWEFTPGFDLELSEEELGRLSEACRLRVLHYAYYNARRMRYILCSDDARFINHSDQPNTVDVGFGDSAVSEGQTFAARAVQLGEEITSDYRSFEEPGRLLASGLHRAY